jgi:hypothetical protein
MCGPHTDSAGLAAGEAEEPTSAAKVTRLSARPSRPAHASGVARLTVRPSLADIENGPRLSDRQSFHLKRLQMSRSARGTRATALSRMTGKQTRRTTMHTGDRRSTVGDAGGNGGTQVVDVAVGFGSIVSGLSPALQVDFKLGARMALLALIRESLPAIRESDMIDDWLQPGARTLYIAQFSDTAMSAMVAQVIADAIAEAPISVTVYDQTYASDGLSASAAPVEEDTESPLPVVPEEDDNLPATPLPHRPVLVDADVALPPNPAETEVGCEAALPPTPLPEVGVDYDELALPPTPASLRGTGDDADLDLPAPDDGCDFPRPHAPHTQSRNHAHIFQCAHGLISLCAVAPTLSPAAER